MEFLYASILIVYLFFIDKWVGTISDAIREGRSSEKIKSYRAGSAVEEKLEKAGGAPTSVVEKDPSEFVHAISRATAVKGFGGVRKDDGKGE